MGYQWHFTKGTLIKQYQSARVCMRVHMHVVCVCVFMSETEGGCPLGNSE